MKITNLRCEYQSNPLGIGVPRPRLSWMLEDHTRGARQSAYQIQAASNEPLLIQGPVDLWDSGQVISDQTHLIPYGGSALTSRQTVFWRVRVWDGAGNPSEWSEIAFWELGLQNVSDWQGKWIGSILAGGPVTSSPAPFLRTDFRIDQDIVQARLYITALGLYEAHINGRVVHDEKFAPGWTDYHRRVPYQVYDVSRFLNVGENTFGAVLGDGWYCG